MSNQFFERFDKKEINLPIWIFKIYFKVLLPWSLYLHCNGFTICLMVQLLIFQMKEFLCMFLKWMLGLFASLSLGCLLRGASWVQRVKKRFVCCWSSEVSTTGFTTWSCYQKISCSSHFVVRSYRNSVRLLGLPQFLSFIKECFFARLTL